MNLTTKTARKVQLALAMGAVASSLGTTASALAGPTLSNLINLTNSAELTVNNVAGQSFSVNGILSAGAITPFAAATGLALINTGLVTLAMSAAVLNPMLGAGLTSTYSINANVTNGVTTGVVGLASLTNVRINGPESAVSTVGASISNTIFGVSNVRSTSAFTNQVTTSLTAF